MSEPTTWRTVTMPDGRVAEFLDAKMLARDGDQLVVEVTYRLDGALGQLVVSVPASLLDDKP